MVNKIIISVEKKLTIKSYNKSEKNRPQVVNQELTDVKRNNYSFKGKQRSFYRTFLFYYLYDSPNIRYMSYSKNVKTFSTRRNSLSIV